ncbi:MAG: penicillin acylase family protein [Deltaproteobacteria bacterium]|nr:penicillin acylase family protein [Deltaproteobacteria bacterium]
MRSLTVALAALVAVAACGEGGEDGPFASLPKDGDFEVGSDAQVHVARDVYGVAHIYAHSVRDAALVQGYVMAHDRLPQMDILRRFGGGTLAELFGALDPSVIDTDLEMRIHRMRPLAEATFLALAQSEDATDREVVDLLTRFADGVNLYAQHVRDGVWVLDPEIAASFSADSFAAWTPIDSLVLGRFQAFALSWSTPFELDLTELYQRLEDFYDDAPPAQVDRFRRRGISRDIMTFAPVGTDPTIAGFPNVVEDTGTRADAGRPQEKPTATTAPARPRVPLELFGAARSFFARTIRTGPLGSLGPHAFMRPYSGSNNWAVGPALTGSDALLASDQHLQLPNPSIFYPTHLIVDDPDAELDVMGITFPGIPGVILGTNGNVAWAATVSEHDVNDVYLEQIVPCPRGDGDCVSFEGDAVPIETFDETIRIGALGTITGQRVVQYERVPHHGPIIPEVANHALVPRTGATALSVRYTGYVPTFEIRALWKLARANDVDDAFRALADFSYGSQNWTMIDNKGPSIAWTTNAVLPNRDPAAYTWNATANPTGSAPFLVLDGRGGFEWETGENARMSARYIPHAIDPLQGYLATANADPVGATFDNDPLGGADQPMVDGRPLYAGVTYAAGVREERITDLIVARTQTLETMAAAQHDNRSMMGAKLAPPILAALAFLDDDAAAPADTRAFLAALPAPRRAILASARAILAAWTFATPAAIDAGDDDSAATALFNAWMHFFITDALGDEFDALPQSAGVGPFPVFRLDDNALARIVYRLLVSPARFVQLPATGQPVLCDRLASPTDDSCTTVILEAMLEAVDHLTATFGTAAPDAWRWGHLHRLTMHPLFPNPRLDLPGPGEGERPGFAKAGDNFNVNRSDMGWSDLDFAQSADGPAQRFLARAAPGETISVKWALPGGVIFDSRNRHYRDLLDRYYLPQTHFDAPFDIPSIVRDGESRWEFH